MYIQKSTRKPIRANDEAEVVETSDLLFEADDVADLVAEVTGEEVTAEPAADGESVVFTVGDEEYTVEAEGGEEILEARRARKNSKSIKASSKAHSGRVIRKIPRSR